MNHASLFSGIGGFDLAALWMGWNNVFQVEKDKWCIKVLEKNFPNSKRYGDIKEFYGTEYKGSIDVISGGFPCQPFSVAGKQKGKDDDRFLWPEMLRIITEVQPKFIVGENVAGIIGMALDKVLSDLEAQGYTTETYIIPACSKNAWHRRDRVWIVAYSDAIGWNNGGNNREERHIRTDERITKENKSERKGRKCKTCKASAVYAYTKSKPRNERENGNDTEQRKIQLQTRGSNSLSTDTYNTKCKKQWEYITNEEKLFAPRCHSWWETEPAVGRVVNGLSGRVDRLKGLGNAIVPQVVYEIFKSIDCIYKKQK